MLSILFDHGSVQYNGYKLFYDYFKRQHEVVVMRIALESNCLDSNLSDDNYYQIELNKQYLCLSLFNHIMK